MIDYSEEVIFGLLWCMGSMKAISHLSIIVVYWYIYASLILDELRKTYNIYRREFDMTMELKHDDNILSYRRFMQKLGMCW